MPMGEKQVLKPLWVYTEGRRNILPRGIFDLGKDGFTMDISKYTVKELEDIRHITIKLTVFLPKNTKTGWRSFKNS